LAIYHCPTDQSTVELPDGTKLTQPRNRSYNLSQSVNGYPEYATNIYPKIPAFRKLASVRNPEPVQCLTFIDESEDTMDDSLFGMPTDNYGGSGNWWDMPSNRHQQGANLAFADGHVEHWHWRVPIVLRGKFPDAIPQGVLPEEMPDYNRLRGAVLQTWN
jgi:prepilin-type processing-associated H-X9-DG protein